MFLARGDSLYPTLFIYRERAVFVDREKSFVSAEFG